MSSEIFGKSRGDLLTRLIPPAKASGFPPITNERILFMKSETKVFMEGIWKEQKVDRWKRNHKAIEKEKEQIKKEKEYENFIFPDGSHYNIESPVGMYEERTEAARTLYNKSHLIKMTKGGFYRKLKSNKIVTEVRRNGIIIKEIGDVNSEYTFFGTDEVKDLSSYGPKREGKNCQEVAEQKRRWLILHIKGRLKSLWGLKDTRFAVKVGILTTAIMILLSQM